MEERDRGRERAREWGAGVRGDEMSVESALANQRVKERERMRHGRGRSEQRDKETLGKRSWGDLLKGVERGEGKAGERTCEQDLWRIRG